MAKMDKETKQTIKQAVYLDKRSKSLDKKSDAQVTIEKFWDHFDGYNELNGKRYFVNTGIFGALRSDDLDDQRMRAKYRGGAERASLVFETIGAAIIDTLALPFTLTAGIVMNFLNFTGITTRLKNRASKKAKKIYAKKNEVDLELLDHLYKNNQIEKIEVYHDDRIWTKKDMPFLKSWNIREIQELALQEKEKGNMDNYNEYKNLANALNENQCKYWNWDVESNKLKWEDEEKLVEAQMGTKEQDTAENNEKENFDKLVDACKKSGLTEEETSKVLKDAGYQQGNNNVDTKKETMTNTKEKNIEEQKSETF